jgi:TonB-dependent receptor
MYSTVSNLRIRTQSLLLGTALATGIGAISLSAPPAFAEGTGLLAPIQVTGQVAHFDDGTLLTADAGDAGGIETVVVTGYAASLAKSTDAKRNATNFTDSVFAQDIGKFPDTNIAESLNRIPGVTIQRDNDDEGVNVSIRGLGTNFTKILLNNAQVAVATTGAVDQSNNNREVDLNMFPTELFTQLTVSKTPTADQVEGGAAGTVNMRSDRPFDNPGMHFSYNLQGTDYSNANSPGERGAAIASDTWGPVGVLVGVAGVHNNVFTKGWEDGNAGWVGPSLATSGANIQCSPAASCGTFGSKSWGVPAAIPNNVNVPIPGAPGTFYPAGTPVNQALLQTLNPGLSITQLSNALLPRLGRPMFEAGTRDRYNGIVSLEYRPNDNLHFYLDGIFGRTFNNLNRSDLDWGVRAGAGAQPMIPANVVLTPASLAATGNAGGQVQSGTFYNSQFSLEARPYKEKGDFLSLNPGMMWTPMDLLEVDFQANISRSHFFRDSPTVLVVTGPSAGNPAGVPGATPLPGGVVTTFNDPSGAPFPSITTNLDLNNPANFQWANGRVNLQDEKRYTFTEGLHLDATYGGPEIAVKVGAAYDDVYRSITAIDASTTWQDAICGDNPNAVLPAPNSVPSCDGLNVTGSTAVVNAAAPGQVPPYPGYGTGYSASFPPLAYGGSLVPQSALASYLVPGPTGFITANYNAIKKASNYYAIDQAAIAAVGNPHTGSVETYPYSTASNTGGNSGIIEEKNIGLYAELNGDVNVDHDLKYNVGLRWVQTLQAVTSPVTVVNPLNAGLTNGGLYPNSFVFQTQKHDYAAFLPSINLVYMISDDFQVRGSLSRTMTRPNPNFMVAGVNFSDLAAQSVGLGNPNLKPYFSNNIDLGAEYYTGGEGYFGVAIFRKSLSGFPQQVNITQPFSYLDQFGINYGGLNATQQQAICNRTPGCNIATATQATVANTTVTVTEQVNEPGILTINGIELDYVQPLDFVLDQYGLKGFGFTGNVTILDPSSSGAAPINPTGVARLAYNMTGYYENNGLMARVSYVWNDRTYGSGSNTQSVCLPVGSSGSGCPGGAYLFAAPYGQLDLSSSLKLSTVLGDIPSDPDLTFDIQNLTRSKLHTYDQFTNATHSYYNVGMVFLFGLRGEF